MDAALDHSERTLAVLILIIAGGPDKGRVYELTDGEPITLGREGDQVKLNDRKCSREHAKLWSEGGQWYLEDLGSKHGTFRNHTQLEDGQRAKIKDGDYLQIGSTVMVLGKMPAEHAQKLALIGGMSSATPAPKQGNFTKVAAGVSIAALLGLGGYLAWRVEGLQQQLIEAQRQQSDRIAASIDRQAGVSEQLRTEQEKLSDTLGATTRAIGEHEQAVASATSLINGKTVPILERLDAVTTQSENQQTAIHRLGEMLAHQQANDPSPQLLKAMQAIKSSLADQPKADLLLAKLDEAMKTNAKAAGQAVQLALAEHRKDQAAQALLASSATEETTKTTDALLTRVIDSLAKVATREELAKEVKLAFADRNAKNEQFMRLVLAEVKKTGDQIATDVTAVAREDAGQAQALMQKVVTELAKRPSGEQLAADMRTAMDQAFAKRDTQQAEIQAAGQTKLAGLMGKVLSELEQRPTSEQLAADLKRAIGEDAQRTELLIARALTEIEQAPTAKEIARELQAAGNEASDKTAKLLEQVLAKVKTQQELGEQIAKLQTQVAELPGRNTQAVRQVLARLDQQSENGAALLKSIAQLRETMPKNLPGQLDQVLAQLDKQVRTDQITDEIEKVMQRIATASDTRTEQTLTQLSKKLASMPSATELNKLVQSQESLAKLLDTSDARDAIGQLRSSLELLSKKIGVDQPDDPLKQIVAMLKQREKVDLMIAELHDAMGSQSTQTKELQRELLAAMAKVENSETTKTLRDLMGMVSERMATDSSIRQAVRDELRGSLLPNQMAQSDARDITATASNPAATAQTTAGTVKGPRLTALESA